MRIVPYFFLLLLFSACAKSKFPDDVLPPEKMQAVFLDIVKADVLITDYTKKDSTKNPVMESIILQKKILGAHNVTREEFQKSFDYYVAHPELMSAVLDTMVARESKVKSKSKIKQVTAYE